jgi:hypothetical protein
MKYFKKSKEYRASNLTLSVEYPMVAYSYDWYQIAKQFGDTFVLNTYGYSNTTIKHVYKIRRQMEELGFTFDLEIHAPRGLQNLAAAIDYYTIEIQTLEQLIKKPGTRKAKNEERQKQIDDYNTKINQIIALIAIDQRKAV